MSGTLINADTTTTLRANKVKTQDEENILKMDILLPNEKGTYDQTEVNRNKRHLLSVKDNPGELDLDVTKEFFLKYFKDGDDIDSKWVALKSALSSYETTARLTSEIMDFPTTIQTYALTDKPSKEYDAKIHLETMMTNNIIPEWVSLHACVSDIGLRQLTWNTNDGYYSYNNSDSESGNLFIKFQNSDDENKGTYTIKYVEKDTNYSDIKTFNKTIDIDLKNSKIVSVEKTAGGVNSVNKGPIELYYKVDTDGSTPIDGGVETLEMVAIIDGEDSCFNYNCQYQNNQYNDCQYTNQFYNKNIDNKSLFRGGSITLNITTEDSGEVSTTMYNHIKTEFEKKYGSFDTFITNLGGELELEGGYGRKATLTINPTGGDKQHIKITNKGYLYKEKDTLRFKDFRLRDLVYINVTSIDSTDDSETSEYLQEFIAPGASKSNTIKYALGIKEHFLIKNITITGSVQSNVIVRLNHIKDCFGTQPISYILKEFYFYGRTNINDSHDVNILITSGTVDEFYIDLQKIVKGKDDKEKMDTLSFTLNGIKFTDFD